ncbi:MAG: winged helix-turn-helix domain-containing protein [Alcanivoracaceae bacterium]|nr:winged helix-turn-helix domain-containing protein [Alcanivoracaceae bacterium]
MIYSIKKHSIDSKNFIIKQSGNKIEVEPLVFDLIIYLIENRSKLVTREEIFENIWYNRIVSDATLSNHITKARSVLGDDGQSQNIIKTIHGRGYQFIAEIKVTAVQSNNASGVNTIRKNLIYIALLITMVVLAIFIINNSEFRKQNNSDENNQNKSIAVLAFLDMSPNQDNEYFADGISEEILNKLTHIPKLRVISRTSSFYFKDKNLTLKEIGEQLKVSHILEGSVRKQDNKIRITVQLIDIKTSKHVWSESYDKTMDNILQIQDEIAIAVSDKLQLSLLPLYKTEVTVNPDAYTLYLQAKHFTNIRSRDNFKKAELTIKKSIALDPNFAYSWHFLGFIVFESTFNFGMRSYNDGIKTSTYAIKKAISLNANFALPYAALARIQSQQRNFIASEQNLQKALAIDSQSSYILDIAALTSMHRGELEKSLKYRYQIMDINPKYYKNFYSIAQLNYILGNYDVAYQNFDKFIALKPKSAVSHHLMCSVLLAQGETLRALEHAQKETDDFWKHYALSMAVFANGDKQKADKLLMDFIEKYSNTDLANIARIYAFRGETEQSFEWLNKAFDHPDSTLLDWLNYPEFRKMHNDPRWHELIIKMKLPLKHWLMKQLPANVLKTSISAKTIG